MRNEKSKAHRVSGGIANKAAAAYLTRRGKRTRSEPRRLHPSAALAVVFSFGAIVGSGTPALAQNASSQQQPDSLSRDAAGAGNAGTGAQSPQLAVQINNPVTDLWLIETEFDNIKLENDPRSPFSGKWANAFYMQPVLPVKLTEDLSLITRPVIPVYQSVPVPTGPTTSHRRTDFGDIVLAQVLSPQLPKPWIIAAGPTWIFPSAGSRATGQGKWQAGPAVGGGVVTDKYIVAGLVQQWWSFAGDSGRPATNQLAILPKIYAFWGDGWSVGYAGQIQADWTARSGDRWTVPMGLALGKVVHLGILPVQLRLGGDYYPVRPQFGPKWNVQLQITPIIPRLIQEAIFQ